MIGRLHSIITGRLPIIDGLHSGTSNEGKRYTEFFCHLRGIAFGTPGQGLAKQRSCPMHEMILVNGHVADSVCFNRWRADVYLSVPKDRHDELSGSHEPSNSHAHAVCALATEKGVVVQKRLCASLATQEGPRARNL